MEELTERELAVLRLLDSDLSRREIGAALYVSLNTVKTHMRNPAQARRLSPRRGSRTGALARAAVAAQVWRTLSTDTPATIIATPTN